jgi:hypothetical protein
VQISTFGTTAVRLHDVFQSAMAFVTYVLRVRECMMGGAAEVCTAMIASSAP